MSACALSGCISSARRRLTSASSHCLRSCNAAPRLRCASASCGSSSVVRRNAWSASLPCRTSATLRIFHSIPPFGSPLRSARVWCSASLERPSSIIAISAPIFRGSSTCGADTAAAATRPQQCLYFSPLQQRHGSLRAGFMCTFCVAVVLEGTTESVLQRLEPGSEISPLIESITIDGLANLVRAGSAHATLRLVEQQALGLEVEFAEIEHAPHAALQIVDDVLVLYAQ